jgi:hypothetical protein
MKPIGQYKLGAIKPVKEVGGLKFASLIPFKLPKFPPVFNAGASIGFYPPRRILNNDVLQCCVVASSVYYIWHAEYAEQGVLLNNITDKEVKEQYFKETGGPDIGLMPPTHFELWRKEGLALGGQLYRIEGHADIDVKYFEQLKAACNWLWGAQVCAGLPLNCMNQYNQKRRRYEWVVEDGDGSGIGTWGWHMMYCCGYIDTPDGQWVLLWTWGRIIKASLEWYQKYVGQATAILDQRDTWVDQSEVDFDLMREHYNHLKGAN